MHVWFEIRKSIIKAKVTESPDWHSLSYCRRSALHASEEPTHPTLGALSMGGEHCATELPSQPWDFLPDFTFTKASFQVRWLTPVLLAT
jgi:hypothetical protein